MVDATKHASPAAEETSGTPSPEDVKSEESGADVQAVPYHRFQKKVWENQELNEKLQSLSDEVAELRARKPGPAEQPDAPDREEDPVGYAEHIANRAQATAESATVKLQKIEEEQERVRLLSGLQDEFATAIAKYPQLDNDPDMREYAWQHFIFSKERTHGRAEGDEIMKGLHSRFQQYADSVSPEKAERRKLRGEPHRENGGEPARKKAWERDREVPQGEPGQLGGKMSFSTKLDRAMRKTTEQVMERISRQNKRLSGT